MAKVHFFDRHNREIIEPQMIWADRLAIAFWLFTGGIIGLIYAAWGDPGAFALCEKISGVLTVILWFGCRVLDFLFTGRIRPHGT